MKPENFPILQNFQRNIFNSISIGSQGISLDVMTNLKQCWPQRDLFFIYLTKKHPDFAIIQLELLPLYLNRTILEIQIVKNKQFYNQKQYAFDSEYNMIFADNQYKPYFFKDKKDQILCKCLLQNHIVDDIFDQLSLQRENDSQRCIRNFNELNYFKVGFISGKFLRPKKIKFFQDYYHIQAFALKQLYSSMLFVGTRFVYQFKLCSLLTKAKIIKDPFYQIVFKQIKQAQNGLQFQKSFKKLKLSLQDFFQPTSSQSWYNFLSLGFQDNAQKEVIEFSVLYRNVKIKIRKLTRQQQVVIERYYSYFKLKLQKILNNNQQFKLLCVRQLEYTLINGILNQKKWKDIKKQYQNIQFDWKFGSDDTNPAFSALKQKNLQCVRPKTRSFKIKQQQSQIEYQNNQQDQINQKQSKIVLNKKCKKPNVKKQDQPNKNKILQNKQIQAISLSQQLEKYNSKKQLRVGRRSNRWSENEQFMLFLFDKSGIQQFKNLQKVFNKQPFLIQKYFKEYISDIRVKYNTKFLDYKNDPQNINFIKNNQFKQILKQAINSQQRYQKGKGRPKAYVTPIKPDKTPSLKQNLNDSSTTIAQSQANFKKNEIQFTQQQEVIMYLLEKTYGLKGLLAQKLLKAPQNDIIQYFYRKNIKQRGNQLQVFIKARQAYYQEYPQLLQFQSNMHIKVLMNKVLKRIDQ